MVIWVGCMLCYLVLGSYYSALPFVWCGITVFVRRLACARLYCFCICFVFACVLFCSNVVCVKTKPACDVQRAEALPRLGRELLPLWPVPQQGRGRPAHHLFCLSVGQERSQLCAGQHLPAVCAVGPGPVGEVLCKEDLRRPEEATEIVVVVVVACWFVGRRGFIEGGLDGQETVERVSGGGATVEDFFAISWGHLWGVPVTARAA